MNLKKLIFMAPMLLAMSCHHEQRKHPTTPTPPPPPPSSCTATTTIQYSTCSTSTGCTLTFSCPLTTQSPKFSGLRLLSEKIGFSSAIFKASSDPTMNISSIIINQPALLQAAAGTAPTTWYNNSVACTISGTSVTCPLFGPIASDFTINGTLGSENLTLNVTVTDDVSPIATDTTTLIGGSGQFGTTVQRMFDSSMRVQKYAGFGTYGSTSTIFTPPADPTPNWFLVSCPSYSGGTTFQQCSWLAPVIQTGNPVIGINFNGSATPTTDPTSPNLGPTGVTRLLWSGQLNNNGTYDYWHANGTNSSGNANCDGNGTCGRYDSGSPTFTYQGLLATDTSTANLPNACATQKLANDPAFSGMISNPYSWQIPSYPMMMTLTGGLNCTTGTTNASCNNDGFSAVSTPVPAFNSEASLTAILGSSSVFVASGGWNFVGSGGGGLVNFDDLSNLLGVRCVSPAW